MRSAFTLVLFGGLLVPAITSILMAAAFVVFGISNEVWLTVVARTITNTFAVVTLVPLIVHCAERLRSGQRPISVKRAAEGITLSLTILAVCVLLFFLPTDSPERTPLLLYAPLPLLGWATVRFGVSGACAASLTAGAISMLAMVNGYGPLSGADPVENALSLVAFHVVMGIIFLTSAALLEEWRLAGRALSSLSRARFRSIFENNIIPTAIWRDDLRISEANDAFLRLTGFSGADIQDGKLRFDDLANWNGKPGTHEPESSDLLERFGNTELELALRDGRRVPVILGHCRFPPPTKAASSTRSTCPRSAAPKRGACASRVCMRRCSPRCTTRSPCSTVAAPSSKSTIPGVMPWTRARLALRSRAGWRKLSAVLRAAAEQGDRIAVEHLASLRAVLNGTDDRRLLDCREANEGDAGWFEVSFERLRRAEGGAVITRTDVTARRHAEADARNQRHAARAPVARRGSRPALGRLRARAQATADFDPWQRRGGAQPAAKGQRDSGRSSAKSSRTSSRTTSARPRSSSGCARCWARVIRSMRRRPQ